MAAYSVSVGGASPLNPLPVKRLNVAVQGVCSTWGGKVGGTSGIVLYVRLPQAESIEVHTYMYNIAISKLVYAWILSSVDESISLVYSTP